MAAVLALVQFIPYVRDILRRRTRPERATWVIWTALSGLIFASQVAKGAGASLWMSGAQGAGNLLVLVLALMFGVGGFTRRDIIALIVAGVGLAVWAVTQEPTTALLISITVDALGASLTIIKAYHDPGSETLSTWVLSDLSGLLAALAVGQPSFPLLAYPVYVSIANSAVIGGMLLGRRHAAGFLVLCESDDAVL
jgi:hypothetical protein